MNFEIIDNIFQIFVLTGVMLGSAITAVRRKSRNFLFLAYGYACFMMGTTYYLLHLVVTGKVPQIFYVAEISWLAAYLFFLSLALSRRKLRRIQPAVSDIFLTAVSGLMVLLFRIFGPSRLVSLSFAIVLGAIVLCCSEEIRQKNGKRFLEGSLLLVVCLQIILYIVSGFIKNYTRFNLYFGIDIFLTLVMASMFPILRREEKYL